MIAIVSDIHGNLEALEAVLRDIATRGVDCIWCLGDIVGYGPNPIEVTDLVRRNTTLCLLGNHDWALLNRPVGFNTVAARMIYKTREWMEPQNKSPEEVCDRWRYIERLPDIEDQGDYVLVHASPRHRISEYILPTDVSYNREKFAEIFPLFDRYCFVGHSHHPCVITEDLSLVSPKGTDFEVRLDERKTIINVGSVGQPRDGDSRACYITLENGGVCFHRVFYPWEKTRGKLSSLGSNFEILGRRLGLGR